MQMNIKGNKTRISRKVSDVKKQINRNRTTRGLFFLVALPTLLAAIYYYIFAADIYVTRSQYSVNIEGNALGSNNLGMLIPSISNSSNMHEAVIVREYIRSAALVENLEKKAQLREIFSHPNADLIARIPASSSKERFLEGYKDMVQVVVDEQSGISTLIVKAFTPEDAEKLATEILSETEDFVNNMSDRMHEDAIKYSKTELEKTEQELIIANKNLADFRNHNNSFNPSATAGNILQVTAGLEEELAKTRAEIASLRNYMQVDSPKVRGLEAKAAALSSQISQQNQRLANDKGSKLASITQDYESLSLRKDFATKRYELAFSSYEAAKAEAAKKNKYLLTIVNPTRPETAEEPRKLKEIFTVFMACLIAYTLGTLIIAAIKDHIRP